MIFSRKKCVGESKFCDNHPTKTLYISESSARKLAEIVHQETGWPLYRIEYTGRITRRVNARVWPKKQKIIVHINGENVCTILHELAHQCGHHHDWVFKSTHRMLLKLWESKWAPIFAKDVKKITENFIPPKKYKPAFELYPEDLFPSEPPKKMSKNEIVDQIKIAIEEIIDESKGSAVTLGFIGRKLLELKINNIDNLNKTKILLKENGINIK